MQYYREHYKKVNSMISYMVALVVCVIVSIPLMSNAIDLDEAYSMCIAGLDTE